MAQAAKVEQSPAAAEQPLGVATAIALPLLVIKKALIFRNEVALPGTASRLAEDGELLVALPLWAFVITIPALRALLSLAVRVARRPRAGLVRAALLAEEWAMQDVFGLAMVIVFFKLDELATTTTLPAFWVLLATGLMTNLDAWLLRRSVRAGEGGVGRNTDPDQGLAAR